jgi:hypothetical protein
MLGAEGRRLYTPDFLLSLGITHVALVWDSLFPSQQAQFGRSDPKWPTMS